MPHRGDPNALARACGDQSTLLSQKTISEFGTPVGGAARHDKPLGPAALLLIAQDDLPTDEHRFVVRIP